MPKFLFFDIDPAVIQALKQRLPGLLTDKQINYDPDEYGSPVEFEFYVGDVYQLKAQNRVTYWVSAANSYLSMGGGIDGVYCRRDFFKGCREQVQAKLQRTQKFFPVKSLRSNLPILAVGSAMVTHITNDTEPSYDTHMISAPTMEQPDNIQNRPENVYYAMFAVIQVCKNLDKSDIVAVPGLGTGVGGLSASDSAEQVTRAFKDYLLYRSPKYPSDVTVKWQTSDHYLINPPCFI